MTSSEALAEPPFYRAPESTVRPGDLVQLAPVSQATKEHLHVGKEETRKGGGRSGFLLSPTDLPPKVASGQERSRLVVPGLLSWAVLMTRGCDIDHSPQRQLAFWYIECKATAFLPLGYACGIAWVMGRMIGVR